MDDNETETTENYVSNTVSDIDVSTMTTTTIHTIISNISRAPCKNLIESDGHLYVCFEKINFLLMIACLFFILFILFAVLGNLTVIVAILKERKLRTPSSYLILSLAITDLIVGGVTVPMRALNEILDYGTWHYSATLCDIRVVIDKLCVYCSLLHVLIIAIDRYRTVSNLNYSLTRSAKQIFVYVLGVWIVSFLLASAPMFGWRDDKFLQRIKNGSCFVNKLFSLNFTVWLVIFVIPCTLTAILYIKIFLIIKNRMVSNKPNIQPMKNSSTSNFTTSTTVTNTASNGSGSVSNVKMTNLSNTESNVTKNSNSDSKPEHLDVNEHNKKLRDERKRSENKASRTLILITICIVVCWSPFFTLYTISSIFELKTGYSNSICNMMCYVWINPNYAVAIKNLLKIKF